MDIQFIINYDFPSIMEQYVPRCGRAGRDHGAKRSSDGITTWPTIYSFFTRNVAPLANDIMQLLEMSQQHVDPNLRALVVVKKNVPTKTSRTGVNDRRNHDAEVDGLDNPDSRSPPNLDVLLEL